MYTQKQSRKLMRLFNQLRTLDHYFRNIQEGFGQMAIADAAGNFVPDSEYWIVEFLEGSIAGRHICTAIRLGSTPTDVKAKTTPRHKGASKQSSEKTSTAPTDAELSLTTTVVQRPEGSCNE